MKASTITKIKRFFCSHTEKDIKFYRGDYWGVDDTLVHVMGGNARKWEKCKKCGKEWESEGWYLPPSVAKRLEDRP